MRKKPVHKSASTVAKRVYSPRKKKVVEKKEPEVLKEDKKEKNIEFDISTIISEAPKDDTTVEKDTEQSLDTPTEISLESDQEVEKENVVFEEQTTSKKQSFFELPKDGERDQFRIDNEQLSGVEKSSKKLFFMGVGVFILTVIVSSGLFFLITNTLQNQKKVVVQKQEQPTPTPTIPPINRSEWKFEVLNGTGVAGKAKTASDKLEALGYTVVSTGNADNNDYTTNQISIDPSLKGDVAGLLTDLKSDFGVVSVGDDLTDVKKTTVRLIIGK